MGAGRLTAAQRRALRDALTSSYMGLVAHAPNYNLFLSLAHGDRFYLGKTIRDLCRRGLMELDYRETDPRALCTTAGVMALPPGDVPRLDELPAGSPFKALVAMCQVEQPPDV